MEELKPIFDGNWWWITIMVIIVIIAVVLIVVFQKKSAGAMIIGDRGSASPFWWFLGGRVPGETGKGWNAFSGGDENDGRGGGADGSW